MKKLLILPLLVLLTSCVTYYYPETALEDGVYYAEDDPSYVVYQGGYPYVDYYPWSSLDYFYLGYQPYPGYPYYTGFPFGFGGGYSPWHYPYSYYGYSYVSTMPSGFSGNRGMVIRSNETTKIGKSTIQPVQPGGPSNGVVVGISPSVTVSTPATSSVGSEPAANVANTRPSNRNARSPSSRPARSEPRMSSGASNRSHSSARSPSPRTPRSSPSRPSEKRD